MVIAVVVLLLNSGSPAPKAAAFVPPNPTLTPVGSSRPAGAARTGKGHGKKAGAAPRSLDPSLRYDWLKASEDTKYEGTGRNIFLAQAEIPAALGPGVTDAKKADVPAGPPPPPPPPPITLKFFGFASR